MTLLLFLVALWLLAQTINQKSVLYGLIFIVTAILLAKVVTKRSAITVFLLLLILWFAVQSSPVQTWLVGKISNEFSKRLHTKISIEHVDFAFFNKMILENVLVEDRAKDTILYADNLKVLITDWFFFKDSCQLKYIGLNNATIKLQRSDSVWNYQFIVDYFSKPKTDNNSKEIALNLTRLDFSNIHLLKKDSWRGEDMNLNLQSLQLDADKIDFSRKIARINLLEFSQPEFSITNYIGNKPKSTDTNTVIKNDPLHLRLNPNDWDIIAKSMVISNGFFKDDKLTGKPANNYFDGEHIFFNAINIEGKNIRLNKDTITANLVLSTKERSGIEVKKLSSNIKFYPEAMEFVKMDLQTKNSRLRNFFAMHFNSIDDMSDFLIKVKMEGNFTNADINSDDIAFFAPDLKTWKKNIHITGSIKGTVSDLNARNLIMTAGKNSLLNGNIHITGLPDISKTQIDFKSNDFRTTYGDVVTFIPSLKNIEQPRIDRIEWLRFTGNFKGSINDFVTNGTIQTNLGTIVSNVNMNLSNPKLSIYSGTISTDSFNLGKFLDNDQLGKISFSGKVNGEGLTSQTLNATVDGTITQLYFNDYTYNNIVVNGTLAKSKFNGQIISNDSNLNATMNGLIDFSKHPYTFNFYADVTKADFAKLNIIKQQIQFNGKLDFNFKGDNIDNFIGTARVYNATILKSGQRISFDSLIVNSSIADNNKTITLESNEFNGAFVGVFSIKDLPSAFQTFLNKYYPAYISPAKTKPANQDFSFVISTRKIQDYIDLFDKKLKGFDNATVSGRISSKENMLDLNVDVPHFSYNNIVFTNVSIKGRGSLDSLSMQTDIGDVSVNDSLHFPGTHIHLRSANDLSDVQILTSANQTLNSAKLSAQVQTLPNGLHIKFYPSTFDINSKTWIIDKDGELTLSKNLVEASNLKIHSDDQQILVTTHPSSRGSWNDIHIDLKKINMGDIIPFFVKSDRMEGLLTGSAEISNPYAQPKISFNGQAEQFRLDNDSVGKLDITGDYDTKSNLVNAHINSDNKNYHFNVTGVFKTSDSVNAQPVNVNIDLSDTKIGLLEKYLSGIFSNIKGNATGKLQIVGGGNNLKYIGNVQVKNAELKVNYTQCTYRIPLMNVALKDSSIDFGTFQITDKLDSLHHTGEITEAKLYHHAFTNMRYDFAMNTNKLLLLDTKISDNNLFYGKMIGRASLRFTGPQENMQLYVKGEPNDSSTIFLPITTSRESAEADFIVWRVYGKEMQLQTTDKKSSNITVKLDLTANNYANIDVILDPLTGDHIKTNGHGQLHIEVGTSEDMTIRGRYDIDRGTYDFNLQSIIRKPFIFKKDADNYISWTGSPYDANINIQAIYEAENVHFTDLGITFQSTSVKAFRGPVWVIATLQNKLMKPDISFQIELPPNSSIKNDIDANNALQTIANDPSELTKQASFLIAFDQFGPMSNSSTSFDAGTAAAGLFYNSISGIVSNALTRRLIDFLKKVDPTLHVNFNASLYNGYNAVANSIGVPDLTRSSYDRTNLNLSVGKSFLNERLTFTIGNALDVGLTTAQAQTSPFQFLPNVTMDYKITNDGRVIASLFYRDSYNYVSPANHTENSSGGSISYQRSFDHFSDLFKKKKKKKDKPATPPASQNPSVSSN